MRWPRWLSALRQHIVSRLLFGFFLLSPLPLGLLAWVNYTSFAQSLQSAALSQLSAVADQKLIGAESFMSERLVDSHLIANAPHIRQGLQTLQALPPGSAVHQATRQKLRAYFHDINNLENYQDFLLIAPDGKVLLTLQDSPLAHARLSDPAWRDSGLAHAHFNALALLDSQISHQNTTTESHEIFIVAPVLEHERLLGTVVLRLDSQRLVETLANPRGLGESGAVLLAHHNTAGFTLLNAPLRSRDATASLNAAMLDHAFHDRQGQGLHQDSAGTQLVTAWRYLPTLDWGMLVQMEAEEVFAPLTTMRRHTERAFALLLLVCGLVAWVVGRRLVVPIHSLSRATRHLAEGDLTQRVQPQGGRELIELGHNFNRMAEHLQRNQLELNALLKEKSRALHRSESIFLGIFKHTNVGIAIINAHKQLRDCNDFLAALYGARREDLLGTATQLYTGYPPVHSAAEIARFETLHAELHQGLREHYRIERAFFRHDRSVIWVDMAVSAQKDELGQFLGCVCLLVDITERKRNEEITSQQSRFLRHLTDSLPGMVVYWDRNLRCQFTNRAHCEWFGKTPEEMEGMQAVDLVGKAHFAAIAPRVQAALAGQPQLFEQTIKRPDGQVVHALVHYLPDLVDGQFQGVCVLFNDITEIKLAHQQVEQANQALKLEQTRLHSILQGTQAGIWEWDLHHDTLTLDERTTSMLGYTPQELAPITPDTLARLIHPLDQLQATELLRQHLKGLLPVYSCELRLQHKDGHWVWVMVRGGVVLRNQERWALRMAGTCLEISESKHLTQQLADIRYALDAHAIVAITNAQGVITYANKQFCAIAKYKAEELIGHTHAIVNSGYHPPEFFADMWNTIRSGDIWKGEVCNRAKDGTIYWVDSTISPIMGLDGKPAQYIAIRYDITATKAYEANLIASRQAAEAASQAKSAFLANMSHEIRTPMNGILGMLNLLEHTELTHRQADYAHKARTATQSLLGIINDILDFSKVESGKLSLEHEPFSLDQVLDELAILLCSTQGSKDLEILFDVAPEVPPFLVGDALRLHQVLLNLSGNAIKFTPHGEVLLHIAVRTIQPDQVRLAFSMQDSGIGIAPDKLEFIFEGFSQAESSTTRRFGGTGLGLAICKRLVRLMGGELQVSSVLGQGSCFFFELDFPIAAPDAPGLPAPIPAASAPPLHLLIVDDNASTRRILQAQAHSLGWESTCTRSGEEALTLLQAPTAPVFHAILMDWRMQGIEGLEALRDLRQLPSLKSTALLLMVSAHERDLLMQKTQQENKWLDGYLLKPITRTNLRATVSNACREHEDHTHQPRPRAPLQRPLQGLRLLVVEDNPLNQQVAMGLLNICGAKVEIAGNGLAGVELALAAQPAHDAILMDMQMPDIDGLECTRRIRAHARMQRVPIIAMTANVMEADRQACIDAGMVDHISKPIEMNAVVQTILRHTQNGGADDAPAITTSTTAPVAASARGASEGGANAALLPWVDVRVAISRLGGHQDFYREVARTFLNDAPLQLAALRTELQQGERTATLRGLHTLKSLASTVGAAPLAQAFASEEKAIKQAPESTPLPETSALFARLQEPWEQTLRCIEQALATITAAASTAAIAPTATSETTLLQALDQLSALLQADDMDATLLYADLERDFGAVLGEQLQPLRHAVQQLDFAQALRSCADLKAQHLQSPARNGHAPH